MKRRVVITGGSGFIGTNLVEHYARLGWQVLNVDINPPRNAAHRAYWCNIDILQPESLAQVIHEFQADVLLHFAARTDLDERAGLASYAANIQGVQNVVDVVKAASSINRVVFASSQLVCRIGYHPRDEGDTCPNTLYGHSKVAGERIVRSAVNFGPIWTIVRPTSLWGPWFGVPYRNFFQAIQRGMYVHPGGVNTWKQWGFVLNSTYQVQKLLEAPPGLVHGRTFYLADYKPVLLHDFADLLRYVLRARRIPVLPYWMLRLAARTGDVLKKLGWKMPLLTTFRLHNMVTDEVQDLSPLEEVVGPLPFSLEEGAQITAGWLHISRHVR